MKIDAERAEYIRMAKRWELPEALVGGTLAMRAKAEKFLPKEPAETKPAYTRRLNRAVLLNEFKRNIGTLSGYVFARPFELRDGEEKIEADDALREIIADVDRDGTPLEEFAQNVFEVGASAGLCHILVDMPADAGDGSMQATRELAVRPYFALIHPRDLIGWRTVSVNGQTRLASIRYRTWREGVSDKGGEIMVEQIRVRELIEGGRSQETVYERGEGKDSEWMPVDEPALIDMDKITLATFYAERDGFLTAKPPFEDLAWMNLRWWQSYSDQAHILHVARVPILFGKGLPEVEGDREIGAGAMIEAGPESDLKYVEHAGHAIEAGRRDILDIEERMARLSIETYQTKRATTATEAGIDAKQSMSKGQLMAVNLGQALTKAVEYAADWLGREFPGEVVFNTEFGLRQADQATVTALIAARDRGDLSRRDFLDQLSRIRVIEDLNHEDNDARLDLEAGDTFEQEPPASGDA